MHYVEAKGILSSRNGMNLYRGCQHGCIYCDARSRCYRMDHRFEDIEVKANGVALLEKALRSKRQKCMIATGAMTDPYLPLERELKLTRNALELIDRYGFGVTVLTKSANVLRDLDLLKRINEKTKAVVQMTLTTADDALCRILEPNVSVTSERVKVLRIMGEEGIPTVVWLCPILPFINDTQENVRGILDACVETGVKGIIQFGMGLTLRDGNREYFYAQLDRHFPGLKERYIHTYANRYELPSPDELLLKKLLHSICEENGIWHDNDAIFRYLAEFEEKDLWPQQSLF